MKAFRALVSALALSTLAACTGPESDPNVEEHLAANAAAQTASEPAQAASQPAPESASHARLSIRRGPAYTFWAVDSHAECFRNPPHLSVQALRTSSGETLSISQFAGKTQAVVSDSSGMRLWVSDDGSVQPSFSEQSVIINSEWRSERGGETQTGTLVVMCR